MHRFARANNVGFWNLKNPAEKGAHLCTNKKPSFNKI